MPKVLVSDKMSAMAVQIFRDRGLEVDVKTGLSPDGLKAVIGEYDGLAIRSASKVTADVLASSGRLKVIGRAGIGVDNVDVPAASAKGIVVMNTPFGNAITTAEHAIAMMLSLARQIPLANASTQAGKWEKNRFMGVELTGKTLGIIGCGNIGSIVANRALGLMMKVIAFDPFLSEERAADLGVEKLELDQLLTRADIITLHTPLTDGTRGILNAESLARTKKGVMIINCARGGLVVEKDLKAALESGHVAGAAIDVFEVEPAQENILFGLDSVICTPHLGASTSEAQENVALQIAEQMSDYLLTGAVSNALNVPSVSADEAPRLRPYLKLVELLGGFAGQITQSGLKKIQVEYLGAASLLNAKPLTAALLKGLLAPLMSSVNMVNAPVIARERNIQVSEVKSESCADYHTVVRLTVTTERHVRSVAGTLFGGAFPRLIEINGMTVEAELGEHVLYVLNEDKPGFIGRLGTLLGERGINIASFHLGREEAGGTATVLINVDQPCDEAILSEVRKLPSVVQAMSLSFV